MARCARCGRFMLGLWLVNGYCTKCAEMNRKEAAGERKDQGRAAKGVAESELRQPEPVPPQPEQVRPEDEKESRGRESLIRFIAEQKAAAACPLAGDALDDRQPMTEDDFEIMAPRWFPEEAEIILKASDDHSFAYGYLDREFPEALTGLLEEWTDHMRIWKYCRFMEMIWEKGDPYMRNALAVTVIEGLGCCGGDIWTRFGYYLSDAFRAWINNEAVPGNIMFNHGHGIARLESLNGQDLPVCGLQAPDGDHRDAGRGDDPFMLGAYHIIDGRITRYLGYPERLQNEVKNLTWADTDSEYHRVTFENESGRKDCFHIIFSQFPVGYLSTHIVEAFLHTMLIAHCLTGAQHQENAADAEHFKWSEEEWDRVSVSQRCADAAAALEAFYVNNVMWDDGPIEKSPETGLWGLPARDLYARADQRACEKLVSLLSRLPANTYLIGGNWQHAHRVNTYIGARDDCFVTVIVFDYCSPAEEES